MITIELEDGRQQTHPFELFDGSDVYQHGQTFHLRLSDAGEILEIAPASTADPAHTTVNGYVESVDQDDELVWVYVRAEEGWQRKVMPLSLFRESDLARPGVHFLLELDED